MMTLTETRAARAAAYDAYFAAVDADRADYSTAHLAARDTAYAAYLAACDAHSAILLAARATAESEAADKAAYEAEKAAYSFSP